MQNHNLRSALVDKSMVLGEQFTVLEKMMESPEHDLKKEEEYLRVLLQELRQVEKETEMVIRIENFLWMVRTGFAVPIVAVYSPLLFYLAWRMWYSKRGWW